jgi:hypothetical protein
LRDAVLNFRLGEELAKHINSMPMIVAAQRTAQVPVAPVNLSPGPSPFWRGEPKVPRAPEIPLPLKGGGPWWGFSLRGLEIPTVHVNPALVTIQPAPVITAAEHAVQIVAAPTVNLALPKLIESAPMIVAAAPERRSRAIAAPHAVPDAQPMTVKVNVSYNVNAAAPQDWVRAARQHADELMRIIDSKLQRRARLEFA